MQQAQAPATGEAIRFGLWAAAAAVGFLAVGALWMSTCTGGAGIDTAACGPVQHTLIGLGAPLILTIAAAWSFWRGRGTTAAWHVAGAVLLILAVATLIPAS